MKIIVYDKYGLYTPEAIEKRIQEIIKLNNAILENRYKTLVPTIYSDVLDNLYKDLHLNGIVSKDKNSLIDRSGLRIGYNRAVYNENIRLGAFLELGKKQSILAIKA